MNQQKIASLWSRIGGSLIDLIIVLLISAVILFIWGIYIGFFGTDDYLSTKEAEILWKGRGTLVGLLVDGVYTVLLITGDKQATYGQRAVGVKIIKDNGTPISYGTAIGRWIVSLFSSILLKIGYLMALFDKNNKTLHDLLAGTKVIEADQNQITTNKYENSNLKQSNGTERTNHEMNRVAKKKINEEELWEIVAEEFDSDKRKKGLYAKFFAETNGDEIKIRAMYYKERVAELIKEANEIVVTEKIIDDTEIKINEKIIDYELASDEECISKGWFEKEEIKGFTCFMLLNGKAVVDTEKKQIIYRNKGALKSALATFRVTNKFSTTNMVSEINKS